VGIFRLCLALCVVISHGGNFLSWQPLVGMAIVQSFFIVSGFYMALILDGKYRDKYIFYQNRLLRLGPSYVAVLLASFATLLLIGRGLWEPLSSFSAVLAAKTSLLPFLVTGLNLGVIGQEISCFFINNGGNLEFVRRMMPFDQLLLRYMLVPQAWSISLEIYFYLVAPFLTRCRSTTILSLLFASLTLRFGLHLFGAASDPWQYRFFPTSIVFFLAGVLSYRLYQKYKHVWSSQWLGWFGFLFINAAVMTFGLWRDVLSGSVGYLLGADTLFLIMVPFLIPAVFCFTKNLALDRFLGELSYPIYLNHILLIEWRQELQFSLNFLVVGVLALGLVMQLAIERPLDRWRQSRLYRMKTLAPVLRSERPAPATS
jgi:peptidoglycan/LPS O-acetylase OafA/YrhL